MNSNLAAEVQDALDNHVITHDFDNQWESERYDAIYNHGLRRGYSLCGGYRTQSDVVLPESDDFDFEYINTQGTGNRGDLVMRPKTLRARHARRIGRVIALVKTHGLSIERAIRLDAARGKAQVRYGHETAVVELVLALINSYSKTGIEAIPAWSHGAHRDWVTRHDLPAQGELSAHRYQAAFAIAKAYLALDI